MRLFDSHTHSHLRSFEELQAMAAANIEGLVTCAFLPVKPSGASTLVDLFRWLVNEESARLCKAGLHPLIAVGIHPRCIPDMGWDDALDSLDTFLGSRRAAALGEVGLETGDATECEVLLRQLRIAARHQVPVIVHTPRINKDAMLDATLAILAASGVQAARVVVDHLGGEAVGRVRALGFHVGLTVQPGKLTAADVAEQVRVNGPERLLVDSDLSHVASNPLTVAEVARHLAGDGIDPTVIAAVVGGNLAALFGV